MKKNNNAAVIKKLVATELNKRRAKKSEPSVNDMIKVVLAQLISDKKKSSFHDYFANKQQPFTNEYYDKKDDETKKEISNIKDIVIREFQNRSTRPPAHEDRKDESVIDLIEGALTDPNQMKKLESIVPT